MDGFVADLDAFVISNSSVFNSYNIPVSYNNLSNNTFTVRIYAYNSVDIYGTLWFDEISVNGDVQAIILPVSMMNFKGHPENGRTVLEWETGWEMNSKEFVIERSSDMRAFSTIGVVAASGETTERTYYSFIDNDPPAGISYYRLKLIDQDSSFATCKPIAVDHARQAFEVRVAPNPANAQTITLIAPNSLDALPTLYNSAGTSIPFRCEDDTCGHIRLLPLRPLTSGIYFVVYVKNGQKEQLKVLVP